MYLRIEIHLLFALENERTRSRVNLVQREALLKALHATSVLSFPNATKKVYFNPYTWIYAKAAHNP